MDFNSLKKNLLSRQPKPEYEDVLVTLVTSPTEDTRVKEGRVFFLGDFSARFLENIARNICHQHSSEILGEYFEFISAEDSVKKIPYHKVSLFKHESRLDTYVARITARHFTNEQQKNTKYLSKHTQLDTYRVEISGDDDFSQDEVTDNSWFALLIANEEQSFFSANNINLITKLNIALSQLEDRDRLALQLVVLNDVPLIDAFDELLPYMTLKKPLETFTKKERQDAVSRLKNRALDRLTRKMNELL